MSKYFKWIVILISLVILWFIPSRSDNTIYTTKTLNVSFDNGDHKTIQVTYPSYAYITIHQSKGGHRLSTWEYCMFKGLLVCESVLIYGVVYYE